MAFGVDSEAEDPVGVEVVEEVVVVVGFVPGFEEVDHCITEGHYSRGGSRAYLASYCV